MARKLRVQFPGALYHVVNRGNYRRDVFESAGAAQAFVTALEEATPTFGWRVHAYVVMRNHYHFVVETPKPNLVSGMHWLQSTLATRFNRLRTERGHLFQGRYHAGLIEDFRVLEHVVDYVHLNPVRAGIVPVENAAQFRWSSLGRLIRGSPFTGLVAGDWLQARFGSDAAAAWPRYLEHLAELFGNLEEQKRLGWEGFSCGWALGSAEWSRAVAKDHTQLSLAPGIEAAAARALREAEWNHQLDAALTLFKRSREDLLSERKGRPWKVKLAVQLQRDHGAAVAWLAHNLHLGTPSAARSLISRSKSIKNQHSAA
jgi:REP element-mobilizing transposase RayT